MKRFAPALLAAGFSLCAVFSLGASASATPKTDVPSGWEYRALSTLAADGIIDDYGSQNLRGDRPRTRAQLAKIVAGAIHRLQAKGAGNASKSDLDLLQRLMNGLSDELVLFGVRATDVNDAIKPADRTKRSVPVYIWHGLLPNQAAFFSRTTSPATITGGAADPFVNAFLTTGRNNNPFEHDPMTSRFRVDYKVSGTYTFNDNVAVSVPIRILNYDYRGDFSRQSSFTVQPAAVLNVGSIGAFRNLYLRVGQLDDLASSRLGLTYRAPDDTMQSDGFQNPVQPYENGLKLGGDLNTYTKFQFAFSWLDQALVDTVPGTDSFAYDSYMLMVAPPRTSLIQPGALASAPMGTHMDSFVAAAGPVESVYLREKAAIGTVYVSAVNGVLCPPSGAGCPIGPTQWYYVDRLNQVVFKGPLAVGTIVQISYSTGGAAHDRFEYDRYALQRYHFNARVNQEFKGFPGAQLGFSASRIFDAGTLNDNGLQLGNGGVLSDTVWGLDARVPLWFLRYGNHRSEEPALFAEGAVSKYTPDLYFRPAITDSALVAGLRLKWSTARATIQYQAVGPNFMDGGPLRWFGPAPATFQFWRGNYMPGFLGFSNNLNINRVFEATVTPGCAGTACATRNPDLTYIYPVFNPFVAQGPEYFSRYAPNTRGFTETFSAPIGTHIPVDAEYKLQHLTEMVPNGFGQLAYGPGFASPDRLLYDKTELGLSSKIPVFDEHIGLKFNWQLERLRRNDHTAYSYVPFNTIAGGPDASSSAALNAYLSIPGHTPVLFYPNYVNVVHSDVDIHATVPIARRLDLSVGYDTQVFHGSYGTLPGEEMSQHKDESYLTFMYRLPHSPTSIDFMFGTKRYTDDRLPSYNFNQGRDDLNFNIRF